MERNDTDPVLADATDDFATEVRRAAERLAAPSRRAYTQIVVAYNGSPASRAALERAALIAAHGATITVVAVAEQDGKVTADTPIDPKTQWLRLAEAAALLGRAGHDAFVEAAAGDPAIVVAEIAQALGAELVAAGYGNHSTSHELIARLHGVPGVDVLLAEGEERYDDSM